MNNNRPPRRKKTNRDSLWNILTIVMLLSTLCGCFYFYSLFSDPYSELNFFPPDTPTASAVPPTETAITFPATWTPTVTLEPSPSSTKRPTYTLEPSNTPFTLATATSAFTPTITPKPTGAPYSATISYYDSTTFRFSTPRQTDCTMLLIGGQVLDATVDPKRPKAMIGFIVKMGGSLPGKSFSAQVLSGLAQDSYGAGGFEFVTDVEPVASTQTLWVQLFDQTSALSTPVFVTTYKDCKKNLIVVTFQKK